jgi:hypothetical protein
MNDIEKIFYSHEGSIIHKWEHYFEIYDSHFSRFKNKNPVILEIGVYKGGSIEMWEQYFGKGVQIYGVDINPNCKKLERENVTILIGSQEEVSFLQELKKKIIAADIIIDDGGHTMSQLKTSFEQLYDLVKEDGIYLAEDLHTCYWYQYDGGLGRESNFIEYSKQLIDKLNEWHYASNKVSTFAKSTHGIHYYDSIVVFEKRKKKKPGDIFSGKINDEEIISVPPAKNYWKYFKYLLHKFTSINIP